MKFQKILIRLFFNNLLLISLFSIVGSAQIETAVPRFEKADCAIEIPKGEKVECGFLVVRENRSAKNEKTIRLPIIILKSENPNPQPDPILRTLGGPGGSSLRMVRGRRASPWLKNRDVIIFEQRGTKYAQPALECPEVNAANINSVKEKLSESETKKREISAAKICYERLIKAGIDLSAYNSAESAADIEDLRRALNLKKINLYGVSYSARLMLNVIRDYPNGVRSLVIESTLPLEVNYDEVGVEKLKRTLDLLFARCAADVVCGRAFPNLEREFYAAVRKANAAPLSIEAKEQSTNRTFQIQITGNDLVTWAIDYLLSSDAEFIASAPMQIYKVTKGDYKPLENYASDKLSPSFNSLGMRYSVWCREEIPFQNKSKITRQSIIYQDLKGYAVQSLPEICSVWKISPAKPIENKPVKSETPTFIIAGEYDAYTPPEWGRLAAKNLKNSFFVELPWLAHGAGFSAPQCFREAIAEFFENPLKAPNSSECVEKIRRFYKFTTKEN